MKLRLATGVSGWIALVLLALAHHGAAAGPNDIWKAAADGDVAALKAAIAAGADVNAGDPEKHWSPLIHAARAGKTAAVEALIAARADVSGVSPAGNPALAFAAEGGHVDVVKLLLAKGADPQFCRPPAYVPMTSAIHKGRVEVVKVMLDAGAKVNATNQAGFTALHAAAADGQLEILRLLLARGADVEAPAGEGQVTPAVSAAVTGQLEAIKVLAAKGANLHFTNGDFTLIGAAAENGRSDVVRYLVDQGIDPNTRAKFQYTPTSYACGHGDLALMRDLVARGGRMLAGDRGLVEAIRGGHADCARFAVARGMPLSEDDQSAEMEAALKRGDCEIVTVLLDTERRIRGLPRGGDAEKDVVRAAFAGDVEKLRTLTEGSKMDNPVAFEAAIALAKRQNHAEAAALLEKVGSDVLAAEKHRVAAGRALKKAAEESDAKAAAKALADGAAADFRERGLGVDAMTDAIQRRNAEIVEMLIDHGYPLNDANGPVGIPLRWADGQGDPKIVALLLKGGANPNLLCELFHPLETFAANGHTECVRLLLSSGAKINQQGYGGVTALMQAAERGHVETVKLLLARKAKTGLTNNDGATALDVARANGRDDVVKILKAAGARSALGADRPPALIDNFDRGADVIRRLMADGADPEQFDAKWEITPFKYAVSRSFIKGDGATPIVKLFLEQGVVPTDYPGILVDAIYGQANAKDAGLAIVQLLLAHGADANDGGLWVEHRTPLHMAAELGRLEIARALVKAGARTDARMDSGETPADLAAKNGHAAVAEFLKSAPKAATAPKAN